MKDIKHKNKNNIKFKNIDIKTSKDKLSEDKKEDNYENRKIKEISDDIKNNSIREINNLGKDSLEKTINYVKENKSKEIIEKNILDNQKKLINKYKKILKRIMEENKIIISAIIGIGWALLIVILFLGLYSIVLKDDGKDRINSSNIDTSDIVQVAQSQIGQVGGYPYWSWYGFDTRVSWCACFVSWSAEQCGYIEKGIIPKFAQCENEGVKWFKDNNLWKDNTYIPNPGDIIFFDWENDGHCDHVGIVEKIENDYIYTIEGNTRGDVVQEEKYRFGQICIKGYGIYDNDEK